MTAAPGALYRVYDADGALLYIGRTVSPVIRFQEHQDSKSWWGEASVIRLEHFDTPAELKRAERQAIQQEHPKYNWVGNTGGSIGATAATLTSLSKLGKSIAATRAAREKAFREAEALALDALAEGATEVEVARELGVDRMTVRKWRGKR